jgi:8-oxo-dGTP diphosphatase
MPLNRPTVAVAGVAMRGHKILLIKRAHPPYEGLWTLPGGAVEHNESLKKALRREFKEETNLDIRVEDLAGVTERKDPALGFHFIILDYFVNITGGNLKAGDDAAQARWATLTELENLPTTPQLMEALHDFKVTL